MIANRHPQVPPEKRYRWLLRVMPFVRRVLDLPGWIADRIGHAQAPRRACSVPAMLARPVRASARANGYLSLEKGLMLFSHIRDRAEDGFVTYHAAGRNAFAVGGLHGPREGYVPTLRAFRERMTRFGYRRLLLFPVAGEELHEVRDAGFSTIRTGSEAFVDPSRFDLAGRATADLRQMVNRANRRWPLEVIETDPVQDGAAMNTVWRDWLAHRPNGYRMRLLIGTPAWDLPYDRRYFLARRPGETAAEAFVTLTPGWDGAGWGLDVMARRADAPAGTMEVLIVEVLRRLAAEGIERFSLGACPMYEAPTVPGEPRSYLRRVFRFLFRSTIGNALFHFQSLAYFKGKFDPVWEPVYVAAWPDAGPWSMYVGVRMWGLFGVPERDE